MITQLEVEQCSNCGAPHVEGIKRRQGGMEISFCCRQCVGLFNQHEHIAI